MVLIIVAVVLLFIVDIPFGEYLDKIDDPSFYRNLKNNIVDFYQHNLSGDVDHYLVRPAIAIWNTLIIDTILEPLKEFLQKISKK